MVTVPDGYVALDFVGFTDKGSYSASETYMQNDLVHKDNNVWRCLIDNITNVTPVEGDTWTIFIKAPAGINIATDSTTGTVMGNTDEIIIGTDGKMSISSSFTEQTSLAEISGTETKKTLFGKIAYAIKDYISHKADTTIHSNTKNTAGSTNSTSKLFLVGAKSQAANPQTYSRSSAYVGEDGCLYSNSTKTSVEGHTHEASEVTFDDGNDAETKVGSLNGITSDITGESEDIAASIKVVNESYNALNDSLNTRFTSNITSAQICFRHFLFGGSIVAGQCVKLGGIINAIPVGYDLVGVLLTPHASVHIAMSWLPDEEYSIYAYSETFSGTFDYDALVILAR